MSQLEEGHPAITSTSTNATTADQGHGSPISSKRSRSSSTTTTTGSSTSEGPPLSSAVNRHHENAMTSTRMTTTMTTATTSSSLSTFLHRDIQPEGHRFLLPFLTTKDRLRLSECSQGLISYRHHLSRVKIVPHPSPTPSMKRGLLRLLLDQKPGGLEYLRLGHESLFNVLDLASWGCFEGLKTLDLNYINAKKEEEVAYLRRGLLGGGLKTLEELNLERNSMSHVDLLSIIGAITSGVCPGLKRLDLSEPFVTSHDNTGTRSIGQALAEALQSGHCHHLQELDLSCIELGEQGLVALARALQGGSCPQLVKLGLSYCRMSVADGRALAMALRSMACPDLEVLNASYNRDLDDDAWVAIFEAIEAGGCPNLKKLDYRDVRMGTLAGTALGHAVRSGHCHQLQELSLAECFTDLSSRLRVLEAINQASLPNLIDLWLKWGYMGRDYGRMLGQAIGRGALPKLETLGLGEGDPFCDEGVVDVMAGIEAGGCPRLKQINMFGFSMGPVGGQALARALASGKLPYLELLSVGESNDDNQVLIGDHAMTEVIMGLRHCPRLALIGFCRTGMGQEAGHALLDALRERVWADLYYVNVSFNPDLGDDVVGEGLGSVLQEGDVPWLKHLNVRRTGISREGADRLLGVLEKGGVCPKLKRVRMDQCWIDEGWKRRIGRRRVELTYY